MPANFCDDAPSYCKVMSCIVIGGIGQYAIYITFYIRFHYFFFAKYYLVTLRNTHLNFCRDTASCFKVCGKINIGGLPS